MAASFGSNENITVVLEGPFGSGGTMAKLTQVQLPAAGWKGGESPYFQVVQVDGISVSSKVDLQPTAAQLEAFRAMELALTTENDAGVVTVFAIGDRPGEDITMQATLMEVVA